MKGRISLYAAFTIGLVAAYPARALEVGQRDDFQDGTTQGWEAGAFSPARRSTLSARTPIDAWR